MFDVNKIRKDFPILERKIGGKDLVYLDSAATSQKPTQVLEALEDYYRNHNANIHRGVHTLSVEATEMVDKAREKVRKFVGANSKREIIFVRNATEAINLVAYTWGEKEIGTGDSIVVSLMEHHSNFVPWQQLAAKKGANFRVVGVDENGKLDLQELEKVLDDSVKLVALTAVSNVLGTINPVEQVVQMVKKKTKAKVLVDGAQLVPHMAVSVEGLGIDWLAFSGHKCLAPTGIGVLWGRERLLEEMDPFLYGGDMISEVTVSKTTWAELPSKFEAGTVDIAGIVGLGAAIDYLSALGMDEVRRHEMELVAYGLEELGKRKEVELYGPKQVEDRGGVLTFNVQGVHAHDAAQVLDSLGIAVRSGQHCGAPIVTSFGVPAMLRASVYIYNDLGEIDKLVAGLDKVKEVFRQ